MSIINVPNDQATIAAAIAAASASDIIEVTAGTYAEGDLARVLTSLTIRGVSGAPWVLNATGFTNGIRAYTSWTIQNAEIYGATSHAIVGNGSNRAFVVEDCILRDCGGHGISAILTAGAVRRCEIHDVNVGINVGTTQSPPIESCVIYDTTGNGINAVQSSPKQCTVVAAGASGIVVTSVGVPVNCTVEDCTSNGISAAAATNCNALGNGTNFAGGSSGTTVSSGFVNKAGRDLHLSGGSALIGAGAASGVTLDRDGVAFESPPAVGAYEIGDTDGPVVAFTSATRVTVAAYTATGTAADDSGVSGVEVRLNGGAWVSATGTTSWSKALTLTQGVNTIQARATDGIGNVTSPVVELDVYLPPDPPALTGACLEGWL